MAGDAVPALVVLILRNRYMQESPLWAAHRGDLRQAASILRKTRNINVDVAPDVPEPSRRILSMPQTARVLFQPHYRGRIMRTGRQHEAAHVMLPTVYP